MVGGFLIVLRREAHSDFEKIEGTLGDEWYRIQSYIWSNDVKNTVDDLTTFIATETRRWKRKKSLEPLNDIFGDSSKLTLLTGRLHDIKTTYEAYISFNDILETFAENNEILKKMD